MNALRNKILYAINNYNSAKSSWEYFCLFIQFPFHKSYHYKWLMSMLSCFKEIPDTSKKYFFMQTFARANETSNE